jgi:hypothetical protein
LYQGTIEVLFGARAEKGMNNKGFALEELQPYQSIRLFSRAAS